MKKYFFLFLLTLSILFANTACTVPSSPDPTPTHRVTIAELENDFKNADLYAAVVASGFTYADEVTNLTYGDEAIPTETNLTGIEHLVGLTNIALDSLKLVSEADITPLLSLDNVIYLYIKYDHNDPDNPKPGPNAETALTNHFTNPPTVIFSIVDHNTP